jgi:serine/threonine protein kinase
MQVDFRTASSYEFQGSVDLRKSIELMLTEQDRAMTSLGQGTKGKGLGIVIESPSSQSALSSNAIHPEDLSKACVAEENGCENNCIRGQGLPQPCKNMLRTEPENARRWDTQEAFSGPGNCASRSRPSVGKGINAEQELRKISWALGFVNTCTAAVDSMPLLCFTKMCGSLLFMAPEVFNGHLYNERCDVYAMAMVYYEILTGMPLQVSLGLTTQRKMFETAEQVCPIPISIHNWDDS